MLKCKYCGKKFETDIISHLFFWFFNICDECDDYYDYKENIEPLYRVSKEK